MGNESGFTLIELILVTVIIAILAGMVTLTFSGRAEEARVRAALGDIKSYESAIELYALEHGDTYPAAIDLLHNSPDGKTYIRDPKPDPWTRDWIYKVPGEIHKNSYDFYSAGKNGIDEGGEGDDITATTQL